MMEYLTKTLAHDEGAHAMPSGAAAASAVLRLPPQQPQARREQEISIELEQPRQQIKMLKQVLSRCYLHNIMEYIAFVLLAMLCNAIRPGAGYMLDIFSLSDCMSSKTYRSRRRSQKVQ